MMTRKYLLLILTFLIVPSACGIFNQQGEEVVITVGNRNITVNEFKRDIKHIISAMGITEKEIKPAIDPLVNRIVEHYLIMEAGIDQGITVSDNELNFFIKDIKKDYTEKLFQEMLLERYVDFDEWREGVRQLLLIKKIVSKATENIKPLTHDEISAYFNSHQEEFRHPSMVKFRQILTGTSGEAEKYLRRLNNGEKMEDLIKESYKMVKPDSRCEGDWVMKGELEETMDKVIFSLPIGKISKVIKTPYGYHIFQVTARRPEGLKSLPDAMKEIEERLSFLKKEAFIKKWLKKLRGLFPVTIKREVLKRMEFV